MINIAEFIEKIRTTSGDKQIDYNGLANKPADAPSDGKQYARKNGAWSEVVALQNADIYIPTGLDKTGATDMSTIIQSALNSGNVYLPVGTYRIDSTLSVIGKNFVCDGEIVANSCNAINITGEYSNVKVKKITATGFTCVSIGGSRWTSDNVVEVEFASGAIGFAVGSDTKNTQYSTIKFERITATQYGIYCWCGGGKYNNETLIYGGALGGTASKGIYCLGANEVRVMFTSIEGIVEEGTGVEFDNSSYNQILGLRTGEDYGLYAFSFKGSSSYNFINTHTLNLQDLDISTLSSTAVGNVIRGKICSKLIEWEYIANEIYIDGYVGVSFVPLANVGASINSASISATTIDSVDYKVISYNKLDSIPKVINLVYGDSTQTNFMLGREYSDAHSACFGYPITFKSWVGNKPIFYDADKNLIADFSSGITSIGKIVMRCVGYTESGSVYTPQWEVLTIPNDKNTMQVGTYTKPSGGIPKTDLASAVQTSLGKADSALQAADINGYATEQYVNNHHDDTKQNVISDLATIRSGAALGATAVQPEAGKGLFSGNYNDLTNKPTIPSAVTEATVSGWGFTKNTGTYSKPSTGIPKTDLASAVQTSLGKADTALQEHQDISGKQDVISDLSTIRSGAALGATALQSVPTTYRTAAEQNVIDNGKQDKITSANKLSYSLISETPTIPSVPTNVSAFANDSGYLTLATLPKYDGGVR